MIAASGLLATPSVVTPPPELPVSVMAPPELISTNFETVALMFTVPVVDCANAVAAKARSNVGNRSARVVTLVVLVFMISVLSFWVKVLVLNNQLEIQHYFSAEVVVDYDR
jgi:hypothetical protein